MTPPTKWLPPSHLHPSPQAHIGPLHSISSRNFKALPLPQTAGQSYLGPTLTNVMGFSEPTLWLEASQASKVGYSPGSRIQGVPSKQGLGYSSHLREGRETIIPQMCKDTNW